MGVVVEKKLSVSSVCFLALSNSLVHTFHFAQSLAHLSHRINILDKDVHLASEHTSLLTDVQPADVNGKVGGNEINNLLKDAHAVDTLNEN